MLYLFQISDRVIVRDIGCDLGPRDFERRAFSGESCSQILYCSVLVWWNNMDAGEKLNHVIVVSYSPFCFPLSSFV